MVILALGFSAGGCGEGISGQELEGAYEVVERVEGPCEGPFESDPPAAEDRYFELRLEDPSGAPPVLAYYPCAAPGDCDAMDDLRRSFGPTGSGWAGAIFTATDLGASCVLRWRLREVFPTDEGIEIVESVHQETDDSLSSDECQDLEASRRRDRMPCVSRTETRARELDDSP